MKEKQFWFRGDEAIAEYIEEVKLANRHEYPSQTLRFIIALAQDSNLGLTPVK